MQAAFTSVQTSAKIWHATLAGLQVVKFGEEDEETYQELGERHAVVAALQVHPKSETRKGGLTVIGKGEKEGLP